MALYVLILVACTSCSLNTVAVSDHSGYMVLKEASPIESKIKSKTDTSTLIEDKQVIDTVAVFLDEGYVVYHNRIESNCTTFHKSESGGIPAKDKHLKDVKRNVKRYFSTSSRAATMKVTTSGSDYMNIASTAYGLTVLCYILYFLSYSEFWGILAFIFITIAFVSLILAVLQVFGIGPRP